MSVCVYNFTGANIKLNFVNCKFTCVTSQFPNRNAVLFPFAPTYVFALSRAKATHYNMLHYFLAHKYLRYNKPHRTPQDAPYLHRC